MAVRALLSKIVVALVVLLGWEARALAAPVHVDASAISSWTVQLYGPSSFDLSTARVVDLDLAPGAWTLYAESFDLAGAVWNPIDFNVAADGTVAYAPALEGVLAGAGTRALTVNGVAITIDDHLSSPHQSLGGIAMPAQPVFTVHVLPGPYVLGMLSYVLGSGFTYNSFVFTANADGSVAYDAPSSSFLAGAGTSTLHVNGLPLHVHDALVGYSHRVYELSSPGGADYDLFVLPGPYDYSVFTLTPGGYSSNDFAFSIGADGTVAYAPSLEPFVHGAGTRTLDVEGFRVHLTTPIVGYSHGVAEIASQTTAHQDVQLVPGDYEYCVSTYYFGYVDNCFPFRVASDGTVAVDAATSLFVNGTGTSTLDVEGYAITVETDVPGYSHGVTEILGESWTTAPLVVNLVPGNYQYAVATYFNGYDANSFYFAITPDGKVQVDVSAAAFTSGSGTSTLHVSGFPVRFDMRALPNATTFVVDEIATEPTASVATVPLVPGNYHFLGGGLDFYFAVNGAGAVTYPASLQGVLFGNGTSQISYGNAGCASSSDCAAGDVCQAGACARDATPPSIVIAPLPDATNQTSIAVHAVATDDGALADAVISRNGVTIATVPIGANGAIDATVPLVEGANTITIVAADAAGNSAGSSATITLDTHAPAIAITSPADGQSLGVATVAVTAQITEPLASTVTIGGTTLALPPGGGLASATVALGSSGWSTIVVTALDAAGNSASTSARVFVDLAAPTLALDVADGLTLGPIAGNALPLHLTVTDVGSTQVTFTSGATATLARGGGSVSVAAPLVEGTNTVGATVVNEGGHAATITRTVRYDTTPPSVAFASPAPGAFVRGTIELSADATDAVSGVASVGFAVDGGTTMTAAASGGVYTLAFDTSLLADGAHALAIVATDVAGNVARSTSSFVVDNTAPAVALTSPATGAYVRGTIAITATASDATSGVGELTIAVNGRGLTTCAASPCTASFDTTALADGPFTVTASATDRAGNPAAPAQAIATSVNEAIGSFLVSPSAGEIDRTELHVAVAVTDPYFKNVECFVGGASLGLSTSPTFAANVSLLQTIDGALDVRCNAQDLAGNVGAQAATIAVKNWTETFFPHTLRLKSEGDRVTMAVRGVNASILLPIGARSLALSVPGGAPVPALLGRAHGRDDDGDCDDHAPKHVDLKFDRKAFVASVRAGVASGAIDLARPVAVTLLAGSHAVGSDSVTIKN